MFVEGSILPNRFASRKKAIGNNQEVAKSKLLGGANSSNDTPVPIDGTK